MEQGSLRCDVNISVRLKGDSNLGTKVEVKNLNSIRFIKKAIEYESKRLIGLHQNNETILQQTRGLNEEDFTTYAIRTKEDEDDYRYFPEPDLPPFLISDEIIEAIRQRMPPSVENIKKELIDQYHLTEYDALQLANDNESLDYFKAITKDTVNNKAAANWVIGPIKNFMSANDIPFEELKIPASQIAKLIQLIEDGKISFGIAAHQVFPQLVKEPLLPLEAFIQENGLGLETSVTHIDSLIQEALEKHAQKITEFKKGKKGLISLFVGEVMKLSKGKADAKIVTEKILEKLKT
jgi:aspartyl-tRNA(Asn)/glutamyl-tRNA(Gln) amidotransferase subunit B